MNIPEKVRIGSMDYKVNRVDEPIIVDNRKCLGSIEYNKKIINIGNNMQDIQGEEETFLHEVFHGIVHERNFEYSKNDDETITEELARGLHQLIKDNPNIFTKTNI